jgi:hypothetical protein
LIEAAADPAPLVRWIHDAIVAAAQAQIDD